MFGLKSWWVSVCVCVYVQTAYFTIVKCSDRSKGSTCSVFSFFFCWMTSGLKKAIHATMLKWWGDEMARLIAILKREKNITRSPFIRLKELYYCFWHCAYKNQSLSFSCFLFFPLIHSHTPTHMLVVILVDIRYGHMLYITESLCDCGLSGGSLLREHLKPIRRTLTRHAMSV